MGTKSKPSNQYFFSSSPCFGVFLFKFSAEALILNHGSVKFPVSYTSICVLELILAQKRSSSLNLRLFVPSLEPFFHSKRPTSVPLAASQTMRFFSPCTNFSHVVKKESRVENVNALIAVYLGMSLSSLPEWQSTTWRPVGSAITASLPENGANLAKVACGYMGNVFSLTRVDFELLVPSC